MWQSSSDADITNESALLVYLEVCQERRTENFQQQAAQLTSYADQD